MRKSIIAFFAICLIAWFLYPYTPKSDSFKLAYFFVTPIIASTVLIIIEYKNKE